MKRFSPFLLAMLCSAAPDARAQYAPPPDRPHPYSDHAEWRDRDAGRPDAPRAETRSTIRLLTGPAFRLGDGPARAGLFAAADLGAAAAGLRVSGNWIGTGTDRGFSLYGAELWIDFGKESDLHPILAAGAGLARVEHQRLVAGESRLEAATLGVALLRATLQYRLPVEGVDARAGLDLSANVRALGGASESTAAWAVAAATVGIGF